MYQAQGFVEPHRINMTQCITVLTHVIYHKLQDSKLSQIDGIARKIRHIEPSKPHRDSFSSTG